jgi:hypothetical protein
MTPLRLLILATLLLLSACSWFGKKHPTPPPTLLIVTGAPTGAQVFVDGSALGEPVPRNDHPEELTVTPGEHQLEIHVGDAVVYREQLFVSPGEHHVVTVLSGLTRQ